MKNLAHLCHEFHADVYVVRELGAWEFEIATELHSWRDIMTNCLLTPSVPPNLTILPAMVTGRPCPWRAAQPPRGLATQ